MRRRNDTEMRNEFNRQVEIRISVFVLTTLQRQGQGNQLLQLAASNVVTCYIRGTIFY